LTLAPLPADSELIPALDKVIHAAMFAGLAILLNWNLTSSGRLVAIFASFVLALAAAGIVELLQEPLPYRSGDALDFIAGAAGAAFGALLFAGTGMWVRARNRR
jgi:VanZ family protein